MDAKTKTATKKSLISALIAVVIVLCGLLVYRSVSPDQSSVPNKEIKGMLDDNEKNKELWALGISSEVYSDKFSKELKQRDLDDEFVWKGLSLKKTDPSKKVQSYSTQIGDNILATFVAHENGDLISITYVVGKSDVPEKDLSQVLSLANITADILNPEGSEKTNKETLASLINKTADELAVNEEAAFDVNVNGVKFATSITKKDGLWVYFEPELKLKDNS